MPSCWKCLLSDFATHRVLFKHGSMARCVAGKLYSLRYASIFTTSSYISVIHHIIQYLWDSWSRSVYIHLYLYVSMLDTNKVTHTLNDIHDQRQNLSTLKHSHLILLCSVIYMLLWEVILIANWFRIITNDNFASFSRQYMHIAHNCLWL